MRVDLRRPRDRNDACAVVGGGRASGKIEVAKLEKLLVMPRSLRDAKAGWGLARQPRQARGEADALQVNEPANIGLLARTVARPSWCCLSSLPLFC
jgi:hypothetical protein